MTVSRVRQDQMKRLYCMGLRATNRGRRDSSRHACVIVNDPLVNRPLRLDDGQSCAAGSDETLVLHGFAGSPQPTVGCVATPHDNDFTLSEASFDERREPTRPRTVARAAQVPRPLTKNFLKNPRRGTQNPEKSARARAWRSATVHQSRGMIGNTLHIASDKRSVKKRW